MFRPRGCRSGSWSCRTGSHGSSSLHTCPEHTLKITTVWGNVETNLRLLIHWHLKHTCGLTTWNIADLNIRNKFLASSLTITSSQKFLMWLFCNRGISVQPPVYSRPWNLKKISFNTYSAVVPSVHMHAIRWVRKQLELLILQFCLYLIITHRLKNMTIREKAYKMTKWIYIML